MSLAAILIAYVGYKIRLGDKVAKSPPLEGVLAAQNHSSPHLLLQKDLLQAKGWPRWPPEGPSRHYPTTLWKQRRINPHQ